MNEQATKRMTEDEVDDDALRAGVWRLLGSLLADVPADDVLTMLRGLQPDDGQEGDPEASDMTRAWSVLHRSADEADHAALRREYQDVFIGVGGGEITPYASYYGSGQLMDKALVDLRNDLIMLGVERQQGVCEPEDHVAAVCEAMALAIEDEAVDVNWQSEFFRRHIDSWMGECLHDLKTAASARFYRGVAEFGLAFIALERRYLGGAA